MNPIVIAVLIGGVGYAVYKFISRPTIDVERKPESELEKGMAKVDKAIGEGAVVLGHLAEGVDWFLSTLAGEKTRTSEAVLFERIWKNRASDKTPFAYYADLKRLAMIYYYSFLNISGSKADKKIPGYSSPTSSWYGNMTASAPPAQTGVKTASVIMQRPFGWNGKILAAEKSIFDFIRANSGRVLIDDTGAIVNTSPAFTSGLENASKLSQFKWKNAQLQGDVEIITFSKIKYATVLSAINSNINTLSVFYNMPFNKPWIGSDPKATYYLITLFPGHSNTFGIFATLNNDKTKILSLTQKKISACNASTHIKIGRLAFFAELGKIYSGFYNKLAVYNTTYTATLT